MANAKTISAFIAELRKHGNAARGFYGWDMLVLKAADHLERLASEIATLRNRVAQLLRYARHTSPMTPNEIFDKWCAEHGWTRQLSLLAVIQAHNDFREA